MGLRSGCGVRVALEEILKGRRHLGVFLELAERESLLKECDLNLFAELEAVDDFLEVGQRLDMGLRFLTDETALQDRGGGEFVGGILQGKSRVGSNGAGGITRGIECPGELVERGRALLGLEGGIFHKRRVDLGSGGVVRLLEKSFGFEEGCGSGLFRIAGCSQKTIHFSDERRILRCIKAQEALVADL